MERLKNKVAMISGATGGIGSTTARRFLDEGARVMLVGRSADKLADLVSRLDGGNRVQSFVAEAHDEAAVQQSVAATIEAFGGLDIVFANAGTEGNMQLLDQISYEDFNEVLQTNVIGVWLAIKHTMAALRHRGGGSIIVSASIASLIGMPMLGAYIASKHAVYGLVKTAALELAASKVRVNAIAPGPIDNRMIQSIEQQMAPGDTAGLREQFKGLIAMGRYGKNEEVANPVLFLASDESSYSTGSIYPIDGGFTAA